MSDDDQTETTDEPGTAAEPETADATDEVASADAEPAAASGGRTVTVPTWAPRALAVAGVLLVALVGFVIGRATDGDGGRDVRPVFSQRDGRQLPGGQTGPGRDGGLPGGPGRDGGRFPGGPGADRDGGRFPGGPGADEGERRGPDRAGPDQDRPSQDGPSQDDAPRDES